MSFQQWRGTVGSNPLGTPGPTSRALTLDSGAVTVGGAAIAFRRALAITLASCAVTVAGSDLTFTRGKALALGSGAVTVTGSALTPTAARVVALGSASVTISGSGVTPKAARVMTLGSASVTVAGSNVTLARSRVLTLGAGAVTVAGSDVTATRTRAITLGGGAVTVAGSAVQFSGTAPFEIDGVSVDVRARSLSIQKTANGRATLDCEVVSLDGSYRPTLGAEIVVRHASSVLFAGTVDHVGESGLGGHGVAPIVNRISAVDFNGLADRRLLVAIRPSESTSARLSWIASELVGVSVHASQVTGVTLPAQTYDYARASDVLKDIALANGADWLWRIDTTKHLRVLASGGDSAPFDVEPNGYAVGDVQVERSLESYRNAVSVRAGDARTFTVTETFTATAGQTSFVTQYPASSNIEQAWPSLLWVNGGSLGPVSWGTGGGGWCWDYDAHTLVREGGYTMALNDSVEITYTAQYPFVAVALDASEIASYGRVDELIERPDILDYDAADDLANAELSKRLLAAKTVRYETRQDGLEVGQVQHITLADRDLDDDAVITSISITNDVGPTRFRYRVRAEVGQFTESYQSTYEQWKK
jgi:hypothetical protein